jgi:superfamily II DNA or RNA helicase
MQIIESKALLFNTRNAAQITALIPKSKIVSTGNNDGDEVLVNWDFDEVQLLRNLGVKDVPSPILGKYKWPGVFTPFDHQRTTAEFLTLYPRCFVFNEAGCVDSDTEYLTPTGWQRIADYQGGQVAQFMPETGYMEFVHPTEFIKKPCDLMVRIQTERGIDQLLSPEHRVLVYSNGGSDKRVVMSAADVQVKHDNCYAGVKDPKGRTVGDPTIAYRHMAFKPHFKAPSGAGIPISDEMLRVQIAVIADGYFGGATTRCVVRLKRERKIVRLRRLLDAAKIEYRERQQDTATAQGFTVFSFVAPTHDKEFGPEFWAATAAQLAIVRDEVMHWDGCDRMGAKGLEFSSTSKHSADFVQYAFAGDEYVARITADYRPDRYTQGVCYSVYVRQKQGSGLLALHSSSRTDNVRLEPSTDGFKYCFSVPSTFLILRRNGCIFTTGNTGKTSAAAWAADYLMRQGKVARVLIICPVSIMETAWRADLFRTLMHRTAAIAQGDRKIRQKVIAGPYEFVIINFDGVRVVLPELCAGGFDLVIIDEANAIKNSQTERWKAVSALIKPDTRIWMMTGTPASQSPLDAYGLAKLVNPNGVPKYFGAFRDKVMVKINQYKWSPREGSRELVHQALQPAIRFTKAECLDLPDLLFTTRDIPLTTQQQKYYDVIKKRMAATAAGGEITATNAAVLLTKLLQISQGAVYTDDKDVVEFDVSSRFNALVEVIEQTDNKVLIFVPFRHSLFLLEEKLTKAGYTLESIHGGVAPAKRGEIIKRFQTEDSPRLLLLIPQATAHGITLTRADQVVWWGPIPSTETYIQANSRAHRAGQSNHVTVTHLQGSPVERRMYSMMQDKVESHLSLVELYKQEIA